MAYSITGFVYLYGFLALAFLSYRFYLTWQREETVVSKGFFLFVALMDLFFFITAIGGLIFANNFQVLKWVVVSAVFFQSSAASVLGYVIPYMKFPKFSPWLGFSIIFISGIVATFLAALTTALPFLESNGVINWNLGPSTEILRPLLFLGTILPIGIILIKQGLALKIKAAKIKAIGLGWIFLVGVVAGLIDFTLTSVFHLGAMSNVISIFVLATSMLLLVVFTQKLPEQKLASKVN